LEQKGKHMSDFNFLGKLVEGLTPEYKRIGTHYLMLRSTPAFEKDTLDDFAGRLRALEQRNTRLSLALEQKIARFETSPFLDSLGVFVEDLRNHRDPANVVELGWNIQIYSGLVLISFVSHAVASFLAPPPHGEDVAFTSLFPCLVGTFLIAEYLHTHFRPKDVFIPMLGWTSLIVCTAHFGYLDLTSRSARLSPLSKVALPLTVYVGLIVENARGRVKGHPTAKA
jgi:hypothetical protein